MILKLIVWFCVSLPQRMFRQFTTMLPTLKFADIRTGGRTRLTTHEHSSRTLLPLKVRSKKSIYGCNCGRRIKFVNWSEQYNQERSITR